MKIVVHISRGVEHIEEWGLAFAEGVRRHGQEVVIADSPGVRHYDADLAVFWGHKKTNIIECQRSRGADYLVMERSYFLNRFTHLSLGFNGLNGYADFMNQGMPDDRWKKFEAKGVCLNDWKEPGSGKFILIAGQVPGDASHAGLVNIEEWYKKSQIRLQMLSDFPVKFRPHPLALTPSRRQLLVPLAQDLYEAEAVVTFNSNTSVDAIFAGTPVICVNEGCMAWDVAQHSVEDINRLIRPDRQQWVNDLSYAQWDIDEIKAGEAWEQSEKEIRMSPFKFNLNDQVRLVFMDERGVIVGRSEFNNGRENMYLVEFGSKTGEWFNESRLTNI